MTRNPRRGVGAPTKMLSASRFVGASGMIGKRRTKSRSMSWFCTACKGLVAKFTAYISRMYFTPNIWVEYFSLLTIERCTSIVENATVEASSVK